MKLYLLNRIKFLHLAFYIKARLGFESKYINESVNFKKDNKIVNSIINIAKI